eukprot:53495_1
MECIQQDKNVKCNYDEYDILMDKYNQTERILNDKCKDYSYDNCIKGVSGTQDTHELNEDIKIDSIGNRNISIMDNLELGKHDNKNVFKKISDFYNNQKEYKYIIMKNIGFVLLHQDNYDMNILSTDNCDKDDYAHENIGILGMDKLNYNR